MSERSAMVGVLKIGCLESGTPPNVGRFSCGAEVRHNTILNGSAAWPRGAAWGGKPWPRSADSYKRWLGDSALTDEDKIKLADQCNIKII